MADLCHGRVMRVSYRRVTVVVCAGNLVLMLAMMYLLGSSLFLKASPLPNLVMAVSPRLAEWRWTSGEGRYSELAELERLKSSDKQRRAFLPVHLIQEVKELQAEKEVDIKRTKSLSAARYKRSAELSQRLAQVKQSNMQSNHYGLLQKWKKKKLKSVQRYEGRHQIGASKWKRVGDAN